MKAIEVSHNTQSYKFLFNVGPSPAPDYEARHLSVCDGRTARIFS